MENAATGQRGGGTPAFAFAIAGRKDAVTTLEGLDLTGPAAFERDCLSFMLDGWPAYPEAGTPDDLFTIDDVRAQVEDLRAATREDDDLQSVLDEIERVVAATAATTQ